MVRATPDPSGVRGALWSLRVSLARGPVARPTANEEVRDAVPSLPNVPARHRLPADYLVLARFRRSLRAVNNAIARGAAAAGLTFQQQAFLLALAAYGGRAVPFADIREELEMDQPSASAILAKLVDMRLVTRSRGRDGRAADVSLTPAGSRTFRESVEKIRAEVQRAEHRAELTALRSDLRAYLTFYLGRGSRTRRMAEPARH